MVIVVISRNVTCSIRVTGVHAAWVEAAREPVALPEVGLVALAVESGVIILRAESVFGTVAIGDLTTFGNALETITQVAVFTRTTLSTDSIFIISGLANGINVTTAIVVQAWVGLGADAVEHDVARLAQAPVARAVEGTMLVGHVGADGHWATSLTVLYLITANVIYLSDNARFVNLVAEIDKETIGSKQVNRFHCFCIGK